MIRSARGRMSHTYRNADAGDLTLNVGDVVTHPAFSHSRGMMRTGRVEVPATDYEITGFGRRGAMLGRNVATGDTGQIGSYPYSGGLGDPEAPWTVRRYGQS